MMVEALYRDGHKQKLLCNERATLKGVVETARKVYPRSDIKFVKVVDNDRNHRRVD